EKANPVLLEPIMELEVAVPDDALGAVNGDLNSRRGRLQGMEPAGGMTTIKAEVPMAEILTYSQALTSMTGGRGDYSMHFLRYEEVPRRVVGLPAHGRRRPTARRLSVRRDTAHAAAAARPERVLVARVRRPRLRRSGRHRLQPHHRARQERRAAGEARGRAAAGRGREA